MTGPTTRSRAQQEEEGTQPSRSRFVAVSNLYSQGEQAEPSGSHGPQGGRQEEELPPPPTLAEVLMLIERGRMDQTRMMEQLVRNTTPEIGRASCRERV